MDNHERLLGKIETSVDAINSKMDDMLFTQRKHAKEIDDLKEYKNKSFGFMTALAALAGGAGAFFSKLLAIFH